VFFELSEYALRKILFFRSELPKISSLCKLAVIKSLQQLMQTDLRALLAEPSGLSHQLHNASFSKVCASDFSLIFIR
jgi:hypothetical protein